MGIVKVFFQEEQKLLIASFLGKVPTSPEEAKKKVLIALWLCKEKYLEANKYLKTVWESLSSFPNRADIFSEAIIHSLSWPDIPLPPERVDYYTRSGGFTVTSGGPAQVNYITQSIIFLWKQEDGVGKDILVQIFKESDSGAYYLFEACHLKDPGLDLTVFLTFLREKLGEEELVMRLLDFGPRALRLLAELDNIIKREANFYVPYFDLAFQIRELITDAISLWNDPGKIKFPEIFKGYKKDIFMSEKKILNNLFESHVSEEKKAILLLMRILDVSARQEGVSIDKYFDDNADLLRDCFTRLGINNVAKAIKNALSFERAGEAREVIQKIAKIIYKTHPLEDIDDIILEVGCRSFSHLLFKLKTFYTEDQRADEFYSTILKIFFDMGNNFLKRCEAQDFTKEIEEYERKLQSGLDLTPYVIWLFNQLVKIFPSLSSREEKKELSSLMASMIYMQDDFLNILSNEMLVPLFSELSIAEIADFILAFQRTEFLSGAIIINALLKQSDIKLVSFFHKSPYMLEGKSYRNLRTRLWERMPFERKERLNQGIKELNKDLI